MSYLSNLELEQCRDYKGLVARGTNGQPTMLSFIWMDRYNRYFIASASSLDSGILHSHNRWCQVCLELDALPENVELTIPQPKVTEVYYQTCDVIDQHNQHRQDNLKTEKNGDKEMGHEGQLGNLLNDCCGYMACVFTGDGFHKASIRVLCVSCRRID